MSQRRINHGLNLSLSAILLLSLSPAALSQTPTDGATALSTSPPAPTAETAPAASPPTQAAASATSAPPATEQPAPTAATPAPSTAATPAAPPPAAKPSKPLSPEAQAKAHYTSRKYRDALNVIATMKPTDQTHYLSALCYQGLLQRKMAAAEFAWLAAYAKDPTVKYNAQRAMAAEKQAQIAARNKGYKQVYIKGMVGPSWVPDVAPTTYDPNWVQNLRNADKRKREEYAQSWKRMKEKYPNMNMDPRSFSTGKDYRH